jgi:hypothetical protein
MCEKLESVNLKSFQKIISKTKKSNPKKPRPITDQKPQKKSTEKPKKTINHCSVCFAFASQLKIWVPICRCPLPSTNRKEQLFVATETTCCWGVLNRVGRAGEYWGISQRISTSFPCNKCEIKEKGLKVQKWQLLLTWKNFWKRGGKSLVFYNEIFERKKKVCGPIVVQDGHKGYVFWKKV